jgi:hypothetical protein
MKKREPQKRGVFDGEERKPLKSYKKRKRDLREEVNRDED